MNTPILFLSLKPKLTDPAWFNVDQPSEDYNEISQLEQEYNNRVRNTHNLTLKFLVTLFRILCRSRLFLSGILT